MSDKGSEITPGDGANLPETNYLQEGFVAPWGLANEERPIHFLWEGNLESLQIHFPEPVELIEGHNIENELDEYTSVQTRVDEISTKVISISQQDLTTDGYFSAKFSIPKIYQKPIVAQRISARIRLEGEKVENWEEITFTIRPVIEVDEKPEKYVIKEETEEFEPINISMRYVGFGMARVNAEAGWGNRLISKGESVWHDFAEAIVESGLYQKETEDLEIKDDWKDEAGVEIPQSEIESFVDEFRSQVKSGSLEDMYNQETIEQLIQFLEADALNEEDGERDIAPIYRQFELLLLGSVLDVIDRHPSENVEMNNAQTLVEIESEMEDILVKFELEDTYGNEYDPIEFTIALEDRRDENGEPIDVEISTDWEEFQMDTAELEQFKEEIKDL